MQGFQTEIQDKCMLRRLDASKISHKLCCTLCDKSALFAELLSIGDAMIRIIRCTKSRELLSIGHPVKITAVNNSTAHSCTMAVHVLRRGMCHNICAPFNRTAVDRCRKCIVHDQRHMMSMGCLRKLLDIKNSQCRVGDGLAENSLCVLFECCIQLFFCTIR